MFSHLIPSRILYFQPFDPIPLKYFQPFEHFQCESSPLFQMPAFLPPHRTETLSVVASCSQWKIFWSFMVFNSSYVVLFLVMIKAVALSRIGLAVLAVMRHNLALNFAEKCFRSVSIMSKQDTKHWSGGKLRRVCCIWEWGLLRSRLISESVSPQLSMPTKPPSYSLEMEALTCGCIFLLFRSRW